MGHFLGINVARGKQNVVLSQRKYATDLPQEAGLLGAKPTEVPTEPKFDLWKEDKDLEDNTQYKRIVGKLIYLTMTRPDIVHVVGLISQFIQKIYEVSLGSYM